MPAASGSIAFLGAAKFQGYWDAQHNHGTGSGLPGAISGFYNPLFTVGASTGGGYAAATGITASAGDYWQLTGSGGINVDGHYNWNLNDWCIYSGSASGGSGKWKRLAFEDTIASIVIGGLTSSSFHMGVANNRHVIFNSGSVHSGSSNFTYDYDTNRLFLTSSTGYLLSLKNTTNSGEFIQCRAHDGNPSIELRQGVGGNGIIYIYGDEGAVRATLSPDAVTLGSTFLSDTAGVGMSSGSYGTNGYVRIRNTDGDIHLSASLDVRIPTNVGLTFGDDGEKIEGDGTDLTIASGAKINLTATSDVHVPQGVGLVFDSAGTEKIESDGTDLTVNSGGDINLTPASTKDVNIPANIGLTFGNDGEKIEGDGTDLTVASSNHITLDAGGDITLDADGANILFKDAGQTIAGLNTNANKDMQISASANLHLSGTRVYVDADSGATLSSTAGTVLIDAVAGAVTIDGHTGVTLQSTNSGDVTLDSVADIILDAAGDNILFKDDGQTIAGFNTNANKDMQISASANLHLSGTRVYINPSSDAAVSIDGGLELTAGQGFTMWADYGTNVNGAFFTTEADGQLTLTTIDYGSGEQAHFIVDVDGDVILDPAQDHVSFGTSGVNGAIKVDTSNVLKFVDNGDNEIFRSIGSHLLTHRRLRLPDNTKLTFGDDNDAHVKYDTGDGYLVVSGSGHGKGILLSGSNLINVGFVQMYGGGLVVDDQKLYFGNHLDSFIQYREAGDDYLVISGSGNGIVLSGSNIVFDGSTAFTTIANASGDVTIDASGDIILDADGANVFFKDGGQTIAGFNTNANKDMQISASANLHLSGSRVYVDSDSGLTLNSTAGAVVVDAAAGAVTIDGHTGVTLQSTNSGDITLDSVADIILDAAGDNILFKDAGETIAGFNTNANKDMQISASANLHLSGTRLYVKTGEMTFDSGGDINLDAAGNNVFFYGNGTKRGGFALGTTGDLVFIDSSNTEVFRIDGSEDALRMASSKKLMLGALEEFLYGDGTDIHFGVGSGGHINIPADIGLTFGDDGEEIEGDGSALTIKGGDINLDSEGDITLDADGANIFFKDAGQTIAGFNTNANKDMQISASTNLHLSGSRVYVDSDSGLTLNSTAGAVLLDAAAGAVTIDGHTGVTLQSTNSGDITLDSVADIILDAAGDNILFKDAGQTIAGFNTNANKDMQISASANLHLSGTRIHVDASGGAGTVLHIDANANASSLVDLDAGQLDIDAADWVKIDAADEIELTTTSADGHIKLVTAHTAGQAIHIDANANAGSIVDIDAGVLDIDADADANITSVGNMNISAGDNNLILSGAAGIRIPDDQKLTFGNNSDSYIYYRETGDDFLTISGSVDPGGIVLSGSVKVAGPLYHTPDVHGGTDAALTTFGVSLVSSDGDGTTYTLANGTVLGQTKEMRLMQHGGGNAVVNVASNGWGGSGTVTFANANDYVKLIWANVGSGGKWYPLLTLTTATNPYG